VTSAAFALRPATRRRIRYVLIGAAVLGTIIGLDTLVLHLTVDPLADVRAYYDAGARLNAGQPLYVQPATTDDASFYRYPPLLAIAFRPLALLPYEAAALIWEAVVVATFGLTVIRLGLRQERTWLLLGWLAPTIAWSIAVGQAQVPMTLLLAMGSPWAVALAANLKLLPALVAIYWLARREWRQLAWFGGAMGALIALQFVLEPAGSLAFLTFTDLAQVGTVENRSLYAIHPALWAASIGVLALLALRYGRTRAGWPLAIALSVLATPRLLLYQLMTLLAGASGPRAVEASVAAAPTPTTPTTPSPLGRPSGAVGR
jgi:hypothetical protein